MAKPDAQPLRELIQAVYSCLYSHPTILTLLQREVGRHDSQVRQAYLAEHASKSTSALRQLLELCCNFGHFRTPLEIRYCAYAVSSLMIHHLSVGDHLQAAFVLTKQRLGPRSGAHFCSSSCGACCARDDLERLYQHAFSQTAAAYLSHSKQKLVVLMIHRFKLGQTLVEN